MYLERHKSALPDFAKDSKLEWKNLNVFVGEDENGKQILFNSSGCVSSGQLLAVMGGSGAGKSTLLNALSGRTNLNEQRVNGWLAINGKRFKCKHQKIIRSMCTYIPQSDILFPTQTVEEALKFYAKLKLPHLSASKQIKRINYLIHILHLDKCRHNLIGSESKRGISGGEKRRVSIAAEILNDADIIFLDEPTSGLDAYTAARTIKTLKQFCVQSNKIIIATIHQPSIEVFYSFSQLLLLADGKTCFNTKMSLVDTVFKDSLRPKTNPADIIIFEVQRHSEQYAEKWQKSKLNPYKTQIDWNNYPKLIESKQIKRASMLLELRLLLKRELMDIVRNKRLSLIRISQVLLFAFVVGFMFMNTPDLHTRKDAALFLLATIPILFGIVSTLVVFPAQKLLFGREYSCKSYSITSWALSYIIIEIPREIIHMIIFTSIVVRMIGLDGSFYAFLFSSLLASFSGGSFGYCVGTVCKTTVDAAQCVPLVFIPLIMFADGFVRLDTLPAIATSLADINPLYYISRSLLLIEFVDTVYDRDLGDTFNKVCDECTDLEDDYYDLLGAASEERSSQFDDICGEKQTGESFLRGNKGLYEEDLEPYWRNLVIIIICLRILAVFTLFVMNKNGFRWMYNKLRKCVKCQSKKKRVVEEKEDENALEMIGQLNDMQNANRQTSAWTMTAGDKKREITAFDRKKSGSPNDVPLLHASTVSFPYSQQARQYIPVKICIFNMEVFFCNPDLFHFMQQPSFTLLTMDKSEIIKMYLGDDEYYDLIKKWLKLWYRRNCVLFITHSSIQTQKIEALLSKLDLLKFFVGNNVNEILEQNSANGNDSHDSVNWNRRIIARGSDYIDLLKHNDVDKDEEQLLDNNMHLMIFEFLKIWQIQNDEILFVDHNESITTYMKQIHLCKVLKLKSTETANMTLQPPTQVGALGPIKSGAEESFSDDIKNIKAQDQHPVLTKDVAEVITDLIPETIVGDDDHLYYKIRVKKLRMDSPGMSPTTSVNLKISGMTKNNLLQRGSTDRTVNFVNVYSPVSPTADMTDNESSVGRSALDIEEKKDMFRGVTDYNTDREESDSEKVDSGKSKSPSVQIAIPPSKVMSAKHLTPDKEPKIMNNFLSSPTASTAL